MKVRVMKVPKMLTGLVRAIPPVRLQIEVVPSQDTSLLCRFERCSSLKGAICRDLLLRDGPRDYGSLYLA